jgi:hypothetical protein
MLRLTAIGLIACIAMGGVLAATGAADPIAQTAASVAKNVKKALRIGKRADRKATNALKTARRAEKAAVAGSRGPTGPAGPQGERGPQGPAGTNGTNGTNGATGATGATGPQGSVGLWAVIEATGSNGTPVRGTASGAGRLGNGTFYVSFAPTDISGCAYLATVGSTSDGTPPALYATVEQRTGTTTDLRLRAFDANGNLTDPGSGNGFHVAVFCP